MTAALIVCTAGVLLFGYYIMVRLDRFMENGGFADSAQSRAKHAVLLYGDPELTGVAAGCLDSRGVTWRAAPSAPLADNASFLAVIALSRRDTENLALCRQAKRLCPDALTFAWCNDADDAFLYADAGVNRAPTGSADASSVRSAVETWLDSETN